MRVQASAAGDPVVTAIVSVYAAERYLRGCLDDLLQQTLGDRVEILVIDACSPEGEGAIVREYARRHANIRYLRTPERECSSKAFNRGAAMARGRYLTTANADDRHRPDFCERMAAALDQHPEFGIVYADSLITRQDNETFAHNTARQRYAWPDYTPTTALSCCLFGAQPVWRRSAHAVAGLWDPGHPRANDQDMFLRIAWKCGAVHLRQTLGLFLQRQDSMSGAANRQATLDDVQKVMAKYRRTIPLEHLFPGLSACDDPLARVAALFELGNLCVVGPYTDAQLALDCWRRALELPCAPADVPRVRSAYASNTAGVLAAAGATVEAERAYLLAGPLPAAAQGLATARAAWQRGARPRLRELAFVGLPHEVVQASRCARGLLPLANGHHAFTPPREQLPWDVFRGPNGVPVTAVDKSWSMPHPRPEPVAEAVAEPAAGPVPTSAEAAPPHLLLVMYGWADSGGGTILPRQVAKAIAARGRRVSVVLAAAQRVDGLPAYAVQRSREDGVDLFAICNRPSAFMDLAAPAREVDDPQVRAVFTALLDELRPDVAHFFNLHNLGMSLPATCRERGIPTVYSSNNYWPLCPRLYLASERLQLCAGPEADGSKCERCLGQTGTAAGHAARWQAAQAMLDRHLDLHLATSTRVRDLFVQNGADPTRIRVLLQEPPTVDAIWREVGSRRAIVTRRDRPLRVGFVGSVMPHKGVHVLAEALQSLPPHAVEAFACGDVQPDYLAALRRFDPRQALRCTGGYGQDDLPALLAGLDVVVVPSVWDDCAPLVVREALAARAPVLGSRIGGIPDFVHDGVNGLLFAPGDARDLARCLLAFVQDPALLGHLQRGIGAPAGFGHYIDELLAVHAGMATPALV